jgi:integrase
MSGRRPLTPLEERKLLRVARTLPARDQALVTTQWLTGFRVSEVLSLTVGHVLRSGAIAQKIGLTPRHLKGGYGRTRWIPVLPELHRALARHLGVLRRQCVPGPDLPLFLSRQKNPDGTARALSRESARLILHAAFRRAGIENDGRLGTHTLRKTWARAVYHHSGHDLALLRVALNHSDVSVTQRYLEVEAEAVEAAIRGCDFTRGPRPKFPGRPAATPPAPEAAAA